MILSNNENDQIGTLGDEAEELEDEVEEDDQIEMLEDEVEEDDQIEMLEDEVEEDDQIEMLGDEVEEDDQSEMSEDEEDSENDQIGILEGEEYTDESENFGKLITRYLIFSKLIHVSFIF
jgi:hypothetical protein